MRSPMQRIRTRLKKIVKRFLVKAMALIIDEKALGIPYRIIHAPLL
jgi:hypothetical protein